MSLWKLYHANKFKISDLIQKCRYTKYVSDLDIKKSYAILGIPEDSDQEKIRSAYLNLVKIYHPDSGSSEADSEQFLKIDKAFKVLLTKKSKERWCTESVNFEIHAQEFDIKHTAPQHRQYLNYDGIGTGTPFQREKQYGKFRAMHAAENVMNHRVQKAQAEEGSLMDKKQISHSHKIKTQYGLDRLVEDLIQEAMARGDFQFLSGIGKPLKDNQNLNPYVDFVTHKLNQVLIQNGFTPEWIMLQKEIREEKQHFIEFLKIERKELGKYPYGTSIENYKWDRLLEDANKKAAEINKKIDKFNLVVPSLQKQMFRVNPQKEAEKVAKYGITKDKIENIQYSADEEIKHNPRNIVSFLESFLVKS